MPKKNEREIEFLENLEKRFEQARPVKDVADKLSAGGHEPYLVGGCLRDLLLGKTPKDWDLTTGAKPEEIQKIFPDSVYENKFGTVGVKTRAEDPAMALVEVTTFRTEGIYTDKRHPDEVKFAKTVEEDLSRRDFTVNAMAFLAKNDSRQSSAVSRESRLIDPFGGKEDLQNKIIRAVGKAAERFDEDALRMMRAVRFSAQLGFEIEESTAKAIKEKSGLLEFIAKERIREEFCKMLMAADAAEGVRKLETLGLLKFVVPELREGVGMEQNLHHIYTVFEHNVNALDYAAKQNFPLHLRIAALLHDVGKPKSRVWKPTPKGTRVNKGEKGEWTFYQHQYIGEKMALPIMDRLKFPKKDTERVALLVREHMFAFDAEIGTARGARRFVNRVGQENVEDLMKLRECDRIGSGTAVAVPARLRKFKAMIEIAMQEPISAKTLKINGQDIMKNLKIEPGPKVGAILAVLLENVLDDPKLNDKEKLLEESKKLGKLSDKELADMRAKARKEIEAAQERIDEGVMAQYGVKVSNPKKKK